LRTGRGRARRLDRRPEPEQPAAERHRAQREPAPAQGEAADDVGQPVQVEEHTAARNCDGEADRDPHQDGLLTIGAPPAHEKRERGEERGGRRRMPAREGRPERGCERVDRRTGTIDRSLHEVRDERVAQRDDDQERRNEAAGNPRPLDRADHDADQEDAGGRCQVRDLDEDAMGRLGAVRLGPSSRRGVDAGERVGPADSDREDADDRPREHGRRQRQRQREAGEDIRIEPAPDEPAGGRVLADLRRDGGGRGAAPPRAKRGAGAAPGGEPGRC